MLGVLLTAFRSARTLFLLCRCYSYTVTCRQFPNLTFAPRNTCHSQAATSRFNAIMSQPDKNNTSKSKNQAFFAYSSRVFFNLWITGRSMFKSWFSMHRLKRKRGKSTLHINFQVSFSSLMSWIMHCFFYI